MHLSVRLFFPSSSISQGTPPALYPRLMVWWMEQSTIMRHGPKTEWGFTFVAVCQYCPILFEQVSSVLGLGATTLCNLLLPQMRLDCCARKENTRS